MTRESRILPQVRYRKTLAQQVQSFVKFFIFLKGAYKIICLRTLKYKVIIVLILFIFLFTALGLFSVSGSTEEKIIKVNSNKKKIFFKEFRFH